MGAQDDRITSPGDHTGEGTASWAAGGTPSTPTASGSTGLIPRKLAGLSANVVLLALFVGAIGLLYLLGMRKGVQTASADVQKTELQVEAVLAQISADIGRTSSQRQTDEVLDTFYYEAKQRQIPLDALRINPFVYTAPGDLLTSQVGPGGETGVPTSKGELLAAVESLQLESVLVRSGESQAVISGNIVREGQLVNGWTVMKIQPRQVLLGWNGKTYVLYLPR